MSGQNDAIKYSSTHKLFDVMCFFRSLHFLIGPNFLMSLLWCLTYHLIFCHEAMSLILPNKHNNFTWFFMYQPETSTYWHETPCIRSRPLYINLRPHVSAQNPTYWSETPRISPRPPHIDLRLHVSAQDPHILTWDPMFQPKTHTYWPETPCISPRPPHIDLRPHVSA